MSPIILIISDFDGTITSKDTSYLSFKSTKQYLNASQHKQDELLLKWNSESANYCSGYLKILNNYLEKCISNNDYNINNLESLLAILDTYSLESRQYLATQKYFDDIVYENAERIVEEIQFHPFAKETILKFQNHQSITCKILSVNWFPMLLHQSLKGIVQSHDVYASTLPILKDNLVDLGAVSTCYGKRNFLQQWKKENSMLNVYLGDTLTDLLALLEANYGIIFGSNSKLCEVVKYFGINVMSLSELIDENKNGVRNNKTGNNEEKILYSTDTWTEIETFVMILADGV